MNTTFYDFLARCLDVLPSPVLVLDSNLYIQAASRAYQQYINADVPLEMGKTRLRDLPGWDDSHHQPFFRTLATGQPAQATTSLTMTDGRVITVTAGQVTGADNATPLTLLQFGASSHEIGLISMQMFQHARMVFYIYDVKAGQFVVRSPLPDSHIDDLPGPYYVSPDRFLAAVHADDRLRVKQALEHLRSGSPTEVEYRMPANGRETHWHTHAYPKMQDGELRYLVGMMQDVTVERIEEETRRKRDQERMQREREQAVLRAKSNFLTLVSHEFRTPLSVIQSSAELLRKYIERMDEAKRDKHFERIEEQVFRLTSMLDEILLIGRIDTQRFEANARRIFIEQFCRDVTRSVQAATGSQHRVSLQTRGVAAPLIVDRDYMEHALAHLIRNAITYAPPDSPIEINIFSTETDVSLQVRDYGPGIPPDDRPHIFEFFYRGANALNIPGNGMGLGLARHVIDLHHGSIEIDHPPDGGTLVNVHLPVNNGLPNRLTG